MRRVNWIARAAIGVSLLLVTSSTTLAVDGEIADFRILTEQEAIARDAAEYAKAYDVSQPEAERRLTMQVELGDLIGSLQAGNPKTFAGGWIAHEPEHEVVVAFTGPRSRIVGLAEASAASPAPLRVVENSAFSLEGLISASARVSSQLTAVAPDASMLVDIQSNGLRVLAPAPIPDSVRSAVRMTGHVPVAFEVRPAIRDSNVYGGHRLTIQGSFPPTTACTTGFTVRNVVTGTTGVVTAGHCTNTLHYWHNGTIHYDIDFAGVRHDADQDWQWHFTPVTDSPLFWDGSAYRTVTGTEPRSTMVGDWVCHYGWVTGYSCGTLTSITFQPGYAGACNGVTCHPVWATLEGSGVRGAEGDSGGPVFSGGRAYGLLKCTAASGSGFICFNTINYISGINNNLAVLTG